MLLQGQIYLSAQTHSLSPNNKSGTLLLFLQYAVALLGIHPKCSYSFLYSMYSSVTGLKTGKGTDIRTLCQKIQGSIEARQRSIKMESRTKSETVQRDSGPRKTTLASASSI
jgi:hypothetical protein